MKAIESLVPAPIPKEWTATGATVSERRQFARSSRTHADAQVAQLVEHVTENHGVGGSIPSLGTSPRGIFGDADRKRWGLSRWPESMKA